MQLKRVTAECCWYSRDVHRRTPAAVHSTFTSQRCTQLLMLPLVMDKQRNK